MSAHQIAGAESRYLILNAELGHMSCHELEHASYRSPVVTTRRRCCGFRGFPRKEMREWRRQERDFVALEMSDATSRGTSHEIQRTCLVLGPWCLVLGPSFVLRPWSVGPRLSGLRTMHYGRTKNEAPRTKDQTRRYGTTAIGACQKATFWPVGSSTVTWQS